MIKLIQQTSDLGKYGFIEKSHLTPLQNYLAVLNYISTKKINYAFHSFDPHLLKFIHLTFDLEREVSNLESYFMPALQNRIITGTLFDYYYRIVSPVKVPKEIRQVLNEIHMFLISQGLTDLFSSYRKKDNKDGTYSFYIE